MHLVERVTANLQERARLDTAASLTQETSSGPKRQGDDIREDIIDKKTKKKKQKKNNRDRHNNKRP
ncbi:hypothetical protein PUN28_019255 [Cardiocondyla obscurior]|uniref:Uncharacterized protein n=1 Tax=Cardiocondyla obscurior TaxID=286306 RepID=A0AAW2EG32_9HYME